MLFSPIPHLGHLPMLTPKKLCRAWSPRKADKGTILINTACSGFNRAQHYEIAVRAIAAEISEWPQQMLHSNGESRVLSPTYAVKSESEKMLDNVHNLRTKDLA